MRDFVRFVARGAAGSLIVSFLSAALLFMLVLGPSGIRALLYSPHFLRGVFPGAIVGAVLWSLTAQKYSRLIALQRMGFGAATVITLLVAGYAFYVSASNSYYDIYFSLDIRPNTLLLILIWNCTEGAVAGLACPARRLYRMEPELKYRARAQLYELAEEEARMAREQIERGKS